MRLFRFLLPFLFILPPVYFTQAQTVADGNRYLENEQYINAGKVFRDLAASQPTASSFFYLGNYYMNLERTDTAQGTYADSARAMFEKGIAADPKFNLNYVGLGACEIFRGRLGQGKTYIDKAVTASKGKDAELLYRAAEAYVVYPANDALEASRLIDMAIRINRSNADYFNLKGDAFILKNETSEAANQYDQAKRIAPGSAKGYIRYGNLLIRAKSYQKALDSYLEGLSRDSLYAPGYRQLGELYYRAQKYENAVQAYSRYIRMTDQRSENQYRYGAFLFLARKYEMALGVLASLPPAFANVYRYRLMGYCQAEMQQPADGLASLEKFFAATDSSRWRTDDIYYHGRLLIESGRDTTAGLARLSKAASLDSARTGAIADFGKRFFEAKRYLRAAEAFELVIQRGKTATQEYFTLGNAYYFGKDYVKADTVYSRLLRMQPKSLLANLFKARCIGSQKLDPEQTKGLAKPYYEAVTLLATPETTEKYKKPLIEAYMYLGSHYTLRKDFPNAHAAWNKVLELDPGNKTAANGLKIKN